MPETGAYVELVATDVVKEFGIHRSSRFKAVDGVSLTVKSGEAIGVVGESGSGKSTLARMLAGVETVTSGSIDFNGVPIRSQLSLTADRLNLRRSVQMVAQDTSSSFDPLKTLRQSVRTPAMRLLELSKNNADQAVDKMLAELELPVALADRYPGQVSGGQRQRFALARALIVRPRIVICDEVVSALDVSVQGAVLNLIRRYCRQNDAGLVFVSHGLPATAFISDRMIVMYRGKVVEDAPTDDVLHRPKHSYTAALLAAYRGRPTQTETAEEVDSVRSAS